MALLARGSPFAVHHLRFPRRPRFSDPRRSLPRTLPCSVPSSAAGTCSVAGASAVTGVDAFATNPKVLLKGMEFPEMERWVQSHGYRSGQALMLWKLLYGNNAWAHCTDELTGLNKDFKQMLSENATFKALYVKNILTSSDGTRKTFADIVHIGRWVSDRNSCNSLQ
uniref:Ribosomal RNA large subunit methyltransferase N n=1 Tax=Anthurium amnicola TaxID=1678845 RepID=A0A1D1XMN5_9ARAE